jgi:hypothetical protein
MDQKNEHFKKLSTARERVIVKCRKLAALSTPHEISSSEELNEGFIAVQNTIYEINRVLAKSTSPTCSPASMIITSSGSISSCLGAGMRQNSSPHDRARSLPGARERHG